MSVLHRLTDAERQAMRDARPHFHPPMLATLTEQRFSNGGWLFELKLDGERAEAVRDGSVVHLVSRNGKSLDQTYPELVDALASQPVDRFVVDGEVVALDAHGVPNFARLQRRMQLSDPDVAGRTGVGVTYFVFDLLHIDGYDVTGLPLSDRKTLLERVLSFRGPIRFSAHRTNDGDAFLEEACRRGFEGLMAKRIDSRYEERRSRAWLKLKCVRGQEFVIGGYTEPRGAREALGALLVGYYDDGELVYAGKVGTGFSTKTLEMLRRRLGPLERPKSPFDRGRPSERGVHWVQPKLVCDIAFTEWTNDGLLRHPRFKGLRRDKDPRHVVREEPRRVP